MSDCGRIQIEGIWFVTSADFDAKAQECERLRKLLQEARDTFGFVSSPLHDRIDAALAPDRESVGE